MASSRPGRCRWDLSPVSSPCLASFEGRSLQERVPTPSILWSHLVSRPVLHYLRSIVRSARLPIMLKTHKGMSLSAFFSRSSALVCPVPTCPIHVSLPPGSCLRRDVVYAISCLHCLAPASYIRLTDRPSHGADHASEYLFWTGWLLGNHPSATALFNHHVATHADFAPSFSFDRVLPGGGNVSRRCL